MPDFQLHLLRQQWQCAVAPGASLLEAAEAAGFALPHSCRNGTCRTCLARVVSGQVRHRIDWPGLSLEEKRDGYCLPCVAEALSDVGLEVTASKADPAAP